MSNGMFQLIAIALSAGLAAFGAFYLARHGLGGTRTRVGYIALCAAALAMCLLRCPPGRATLGYYALMPLLLLIAFEDCFTHRVANRLLLALLVIGALAALPSGGAINRLVALAVYGGVFILVSLISKGALGMGDAKLCGVVGLFIGLVGMFSVLFLASLFACAAGIYVAVTTRDLKREIPFAPAMALAVAVVLALNWMIV